MVNPSPRSPRSVNYGRVLISPFETVDVAIDDGERNGCAAEYQQPAKALITVSLFSFYGRTVSYKSNRAGQEGGGGNWILAEKLDINR